MPIRILFGLVLAAHGLIHLMGFVAYLNLADVEGLPYPTALLGGVLPAPATLVVVLGVLWLAAAGGFVVAGVGVVRGRSWWHPVAAGTALASLVLCALGLPEAQFGLVVDLGVLVLTAVAPRVPGIAAGSTPSAAFGHPSGR